MNLWTKFINDLYIGIYQYSLKYESKELAISNTSFRMKSALFLYYFSAVMFLTYLVVKNYGHFKPNIFQVIAIFLLYFLLYTVLVGNYINKENVNLQFTPDESKKYIRKSIVIFIGGILCFIGTMLLIT